MDQSKPSSTEVSRSTTPNPAANSRFTSQASTAEDLLKSQTVGLVHLSDFRKRRAEALEQKEREAQERSLGRHGTPTGSGAATPRDGASTPQPATKKRKSAKNGKLSFADNEEDEEDSSTSVVGTPRSSTPVNNINKRNEMPAMSDNQGSKPTRRLGPNAKLGVAPKVMTKSALLREAQTREQLRKEFLLLQEAVKATEIIIPFVFYDGTNIPGGKCRIKKGDYIWLFLDRARKVGAELGVGGDKSKKEWARVGVDDLMLVRGEVIVPHHYDFYYFIVNKTVGSHGPLFGYSAQPSSASPATHSNAATPSDLSNFDPLSRPGTKQSKNSGIPDSELEGYDGDPNLTKVVDRRWYEKNKHIFPASVWEEFEPTKDYSKGMRKDAEGNAFFFS